MRLPTDRDVTEFFPLWVHTEYKNRFAKLIAQVRRSVLVGKREGRFDAPTETEPQTPKWQTKINYVITNAPAPRKICGDESTKSLGRQPVRLPLGRRGGGTAGSALEQPLARVGEDEDGGGHVNVERP